MPSHTIVNKEAVGGNQLIIVRTPVLAAAISTTSFVSFIVLNPFKLLQIVVFMVDAFMIAVFKTFICQLYHLPLVRVDRILFLVYFSPVGLTAVTLPDAGLLVNEKFMYGVRSSANDCFTV